MRNLFLAMMLGSVCLLPGCAASHEALPADAHLAGLSWMAGAWMSSDEGVIVEEQWTQPRGGTMFGVNRTVQDDETAFFEYLCIQHTPDGVFYMASPKGRQPAIPFRLVSSGASSATFENLEHDFPQRIIYRREGDMMHARIEGKRNSRLHAEEWTWRKARQ